MNQRMSETMLDPFDHVAVTTDAAEAREHIARARGILLDWDGCTAAGNRPHDFALAFIQRHREKLTIVSNNSTLAPEDISEILANAGVGFRAARIFLAGKEALTSAAAVRGARVLVLASARMKALAYRAGIRLVQDGADIVVLLRDTRFTYAKLERAVESLAAGARLIVSNPDATHPGPGGQRVPETGALLAAIGACVDLSPANLQIIGKPSPFLFERACAALKIPPRTAVMIGDNKDTDVAGAQALGIPSVLVAPGSGLSFSALIGEPEAELRQAAPRTGQHGQRSRTA